MPTLPIIEHLDVLKNILFGFVSCDVMPMIDQFTLESSEETLDAGVVPAVAFAAHAGDEAVLIKQTLVACRGILGGFNRSTQHL